MNYKQFFWFRHGQTDWNAEGRIQGHLDVPLNDLGRQQARLLIAHLRRLGLEALLCSDLSRSRESAEIISKALKIPVFVDSRLRETHLGQMQGLTRHEIEERFGVEFAARLRSIPISDADIEFLGCESGPQVIKRIESAISDFFASNQFTRVGISSHGGVIRRLIYYASGSKEFPPPVPNGILYPLEYETTQGKWRIQTSISL
jgi:broad specificity phosphatase PhoE